MGGAEVEEEAEGAWGGARRSMGNAEVEEKAERAWGTQIGRKQREHEEPRRGGGNGEQRRGRQEVEGTLSL